MDNQDNDSLLDLISVGWGGDSDSTKSDSNKENKNKFIYYSISILFFIAGIILLVFYFIESGKKNKALLYTGIGSIGVGMLILGAVSIIFMRLFELFKALISFLPIPNVF